MSAARTPKLPNPWARLWQVPLLLAGLGVFAYGVYVLATSRPRVPFETHVADIRALLEAKRFDDALKQVREIEPSFTTREQRAELELIRGDAFYLAQQELPAVAPENYRKAIEHYERSVAYGRKESPETAERWGMAALALGDYGEAIKRLAPLAGENDANLRRLAKPLVKAYTHTKPPEYGKVNELLAKMSRLAGESGVDDRVWALCQRMENSVARHDSHEADLAVEEARKALPGVVERNPSGMLHLWIGRIELERGQVDEARKELQEARKQFVVHHVDDGRAALLLGKIAQGKGELGPAKTLYQEVVTTHAGTPVMAAARLGRAEVLAMEGTPNEQMVLDYRQIIKDLDAAERGEVREMPELITMDAVRESLRTQHARYREAKRYEDALTFLKLITETHDNRPVDTDARLAETHEQRADELLAAAEKAAAAEHNDLLTKAIEHYAAAAAAYERHSRGMTRDDDASAASLWRAAQLYDRAGMTERSIDTYKKYVLAWPHDKRDRVPEALHRIGLLYQSLGKFEDAITYYLQNTKENPRTTWAYVSYVQLARCYWTLADTKDVQKQAKERAELYTKAEKTLLLLVEGSEETAITPAANEFRVALFTLGELYYRQGRWSDAILRLEEAVARYPKDPLVPRATFWLADAYRRSAGDIGEEIRKDPAMEGRDQLEKARADRLRRAGALYAELITALDPDLGAKPMPAVEEDTLRHSYLYRGDCLYELGEYVAAIKQYDQAATRFAQTVTAIEAYVQIVNAYQAQKEGGQAKAAAERALWMLKRIPDDAFARGSVGTTRKQYEDFLRLMRAGS